MISFLAPLFYYMLTYAPLIDQYSVHKMNSDSHLKCGEPATVNVYRLECSLSDADSYCFQINFRAGSILSVSLTQLLIRRNLRISNEK